MPELPEVQAHAERLDETFTGRVFDRLQLLKFTALKTAVPAPESAAGHRLTAVDRRGKYLLLHVEPVVFAVHLMQGGRLVPDEKMSAKPRNGQARFVFDDGPALLLTESGTERRAGVWALDAAHATTTPPLDALGPEADRIEPAELLERLHAKNQRVHGFLRDQRSIAGLGRRLANEVCHRAGISPFAMTGRFTAADAEHLVGAIRAVVAEGLADERGRTDMSASKDRPAAVHARTGEACPVCGDTVRAVEYSGYTVNYCATCQTAGKVLADNTTSRFLR